MRAQKHLNLFCRAMNLPCKVIGLLYQVLILILR